MGKTYQHTEAQEYSVEMTLEEFLHLKDEEADWVCGVTVPRDAVSPSAGKVDVGWKLTLNGMQASCPYCGTHDKLQVDQWRAVLPETNQFRLPVENLFGIDPNSQLCDGLAVCDIFHREVSREAQAHTVPLSISEKYLLPTGDHGQNLLNVVRTWLNVRTSLFASSENYKFGGPYAYFGAYECPVCEQMFSVSFRAGHLCDLALTPRCDTGVNFQGYPDSFYKDLNSNKTCQTFKMSAQNLPVHFEDIEEIFDKSGLPCSENIKQAALARPLIIAAAMQCAKVPFQNVDVLGDLLAHDDAPWLLYAFGWGSANLFWTYLAQARGERALLEWAFARGADKLFSDSKYISRSIGIEGMQQVLLVADELCAGKIEQVFSNPRLFAWLLRDVGHNAAYRDREAWEALALLDTPYEYTKRQKRLVAHLSTGVFSLPLTPRELICMGDSVSSLSAVNRPYEVTEKNTFVSFHTGDWNIPTLIRVDLDEQRVISVTVGNREPVQLLPDADCAFQQWLAINKLTWNPWEEGR